MLSAVKPSWPQQLYEDDAQIRHHILMDLAPKVPVSKLRDDNIENINPKTARVTMPSRTDLKKSSSPAAAKKSIAEARRAFIENFNIPLSTPLEETVHQELDEKHSCKKRKISFKVKSVAGGCRRTVTPITTTLSANKVAKLTQKFNELVHEEPKIARAVRRANSTRIRDSGGVSGGDSARKPSVRPKPRGGDDKRAEPKKKASVRRKASVKKLHGRAEPSDAKTISRLRKSCVEELQNVIKPPEERRERELEGCQSVNNETESTKNRNSSKETQKDSVDGSQLHLTKKQSFKKSREASNPAGIAGNVKATIEIFERRKSEPVNSPKFAKSNRSNSDAIGVRCSERFQNSLEKVLTSGAFVDKSSTGSPVLKPKVPEKNVAKTRDLVIRDGVRKFKMMAHRDKEQARSNLSELQSFFEKKNLVPNRLEEKESGDLPGILRQYSFENQVEGSERSCPPGAVKQFVSGAEENKGEVRTRCSLSSPSGISQAVLSMEEKEDDGRSSRSESRRNNSPRVSSSSGPPSIPQVVISPEKNKDSGRSSRSENGRNNSPRVSSPSSISQVLIPEENKADDERSSRSESRRNNSPRISSSSGPSGIPQFKSPEEDKEEDGRSSRSENKRSIFRQCVGSVEETRKTSADAKDRSSPSIPKQLLSAEEANALNTTELSSPSGEETVLEVKSIPQIDKRISVVFSEDTTKDITSRKSSTRSLYETLRITKTTSPSQLLKMAVSEERLTVCESGQVIVKPNNSFLWRTRSRDSSSFNTYASIDYEDIKEDAREESPQVDKIPTYEDSGQENLSSSQEKKSFLHQDKSSSADTNNCILEKVQEVRSVKSFLHQDRSSSTDSFVLQNKSSAEIDKEENLYDVIKNSPGAFLPQNESSSPEHLLRRKNYGSSGKNLYDVVKNTNENRERKESTVVQDNFEDLYDTVDPKPFVPPEVLTRTSEEVNEEKRIYEKVLAKKSSLPEEDEDKRTYEKILAKTDEILKDYKSSKILKLLPYESKSSDSEASSDSKSFHSESPDLKPPDSKWKSSAVTSKDSEWKDNSSIHSYETFYNSNYEEMDDSQYEYPQTLVCSTKLAAPEDIYETLSLKTLPEKGDDSKNGGQPVLEPKEKSELKIYKTPLPTVPTSKFYTIEDPPVPIYNKPLPQLPREDYSSLLSEASAHTQKPPSKKPPLELRGEPDGHYYSPEERSKNSLQEEDDIYSVVKDAEQHSNCYESIGSVLQDGSDPIQATNITVCNRFLFLGDGLDGLLSPYKRSDDLSSSGSNRDSIISCDQQSNSLYGRCGWNLEGGTAASELSSSDRSDDWVDISDPECDEKEEPGFVIVREKQRSKKNPGWSHKVRDQWTKCPKKVVVLEEDASSDPYHYYESLHSDDDFDSFDSESDDDSFTKIHQNDSGVDMGNSQLPEPPGGGSGGSSNIYGLTRLAASAGKHMKRLRRNWSLTKNDITKSLSRMTKKKSSNNLHAPPPPPPPVPPDILRDKTLAKPERLPPPLPTTGPPLSSTGSPLLPAGGFSTAPPVPPPKNSKLKPLRPVPLPPSSPTKANSPTSANSPTKYGSVVKSVGLQQPVKVEASSGDSSRSVYQNVEYKAPQEVGDKSKSSSNSTVRKKNWLKFRRAVSMSEPSQEENQQVAGQQLVKSTFYLSNEVDADTGQINGTRHMSLAANEKPTVPVRRRPAGATTSSVIRPSSTQRPQSPPPPAPLPTLVLNTANEKRPAAKKDKDKMRSTSWYAECGLFKTTSPTSPSKEAPNNNSTPVIVVPPVASSPISVSQPARSPTTCWYAEVGLYQHSGSTPSTSSAENSGNNLPTQQQQQEQYQKLQMNSQEEYYNMRNSINSSTQPEGDDNQNYYSEDFSAGNEDVDNLRKHQSGDMQLLLKDEPLYQFYDAAVAECACQETSSDSDYDGYEEIGTHQHKQDENTEIPAAVSNEEQNPSSEPTTPTRPSARQLVSPVRSRFSGSGNGFLPGRTLWCEIPEVIQSGILGTLSTSQKKLQEAKFEILTSEASYLNSLTVLEEHFMAELDRAGLGETERAQFFGEVPEVRRCSERLLAELEACWQSSVLLRGVCSILHRHCVSPATHLHVYVRYCAAQVHVDAALRRCRSDARFAETLKRLEASPVCQALSLHSFLMLPMQRVTRLPLLVDAVLRRLTPTDEEYEECQNALRALNELVMRCNEGARTAERQAEVQRIARQLEFPPSVPFVDLMDDSNSNSSTHSNGRWLVRSGELTHLVARGVDGSSTTSAPRLTFGKRFTKISITLFLFEDILIVARKKGDDSYAVLQHCPRSFVELSSTPIDLTLTSIPHLLLITMLENHDGRTVELLVACATETDRQRWLDALRPPQSDAPGETVYESWDCPQVRAIHPYRAAQPDELSLARGDVVNVHRKMADGWYHGERLRDGIGGWFPGNHTVEIANPHVRARNLRQRYRLLAFTGSYLNSTSPK